MAGLVLKDFSWLFLVALFFASLLTVLTWLVQYSIGIVRRRGRKEPNTCGSAAGPGTFPSHQQTLGVWGSLLKLGFGREGGGRGGGGAAGGEPEAGVKGLLSSLFAFKSFRESWQRTWVRALNEQACRNGSSIQITFEDNPQLPASASISHVTCTDQSKNTMVLQCHFTADMVTFPVTVTQQSPAAVSMDTYQVAMEPLEAQLEICLEELQEGLLVSWTFSERPLLGLTVTPRLLQRAGSDEKVDVGTIRELVEDTLVSTQPAMIINLQSSESSSVVPGERLVRGLPSPSRGGVPGHRLQVRQLKASNISTTKKGGRGELCCVLELDNPSQIKRTQFLPAPRNPSSELDWREEILLELGLRTKELKLSLVERTSQGEQPLPGQATIPLDPPRGLPLGRQVLSLCPAAGRGVSAGTVSLELGYLEPADPHETHPPGSALTSLTPTKKVERDRTVMPDGTIVTTVTTIQSRPKVDRKLAESQLSNGLDPVAETAIRQLTESASKAAKKTPTKRSTLIISGVSKVPIAEDDTSVSIGYAAAMDAALQGEPCGASGPTSHAEPPRPTGSQGALQQDTDETTQSDISERPSVDDVESETGSTGALETRSLKDHKVGFLRSGTKLLFRRRHRQKDPGCSQSHEDVSNVANGSAVRKKSGSFSRRLIKRFSFRSKSKGKASANGGAEGSEN
ncbi:phospholipid transfer protein C2CD2L-like isoform X2 [Acipenser ruthenus]|uniref:phospholipid transfer protein C2CD2L-like isoform X2 n=1 Tax=Acipenser ruthenus TaxID=7906 RepID=UPI002741FBD8|nr:phospholipid transfer protein C2CD2L-like isoform X2 [Acipenser ruthenus]